MSFGERATFHTRYDHALYGTGDDPRVYALREHWFSDRCDIEGFTRWAAEAGRQLTRAPRDALQDIPVEVLEARNDMHRWLWFLFELFWKDLLDGPPTERLYARKRTWGHLHDGGYTYPYDCGVLRRQLEDWRETNRGPQPVPDYVLAWADELPAHFYSELGGMRTNSIKAIDILVNRTNFEALVVPPAAPPAKIESIGPKPERLGLSKRVADWLLRQLVASIKWLFNHIIAAVVVGVLVTALLAWLGIG